MLRAHGGSLFQDVHLKSSFGFERGQDQHKTQHYFHFKAPWSDDQQLHGISGRSARPHFIKCHGPYPKERLRLVFSLRSQVVNVKWQLFALVNVAIRSFSTTIQVADRVLMEGIRVGTLQDVLQARRPGQPEDSIPIIC